MPDPLSAARRAYEHRDWVTAHREFSSARTHGPLTADDLHALSDAAWWLGSMSEMFESAEEGFRAYVDAGRKRRAGMLAVEIGIGWIMRGDTAVGSGWLARAQRLLDDEEDCAEKGYLEIIGIDGAIMAGRYDDALAGAKRIQDCARTFGDETLAAMGLLAEGKSLLARGDVAAGLAVLDETMLAVVSGRIAPAFAGNIYCSMISVCVGMGDHKRAREWTAATQKWCETFPAAVMFLGICRMHKAQLDVVAGRWEDAQDEAERVCAELAEMNVEAVAEAHYQIGEIRRLRGDHAGADDSYARAHANARDPQPGWALLRLAQGRIPAARAAIAAALDAAREPMARGAMLPAHATIMLAAGEPEAAAASAAELQSLATAFRSPGFEAAAKRAAGAIALAAGRHADALPLLQDARRRFHSLDARYDTAHTGLLLADAYAAAGDDEAATRERDAAEALLAAMGAPRPAALLPGGLSEREAAVLRLVAAGRTNKQIAGELFISAKTVARHLSNIFTKLDVPTRTAAAAYAFEHGLASPRADG